MVLALCLTATPLALAPSFSSSTTRLVARASSSGEDAPRPPPSPPTMTSSATINAALEVPTPPASTSTSLVARAREILTEDGAAGVVQINYYDILKIPYGSSTTEVARAFRARVEEVNSQQQEGGEEITKQALRTLQESFDVLTSDEDRRMYDWALGRFENRKDTYIWPYETDITQRYVEREPPPVMRSFDQEGNDKVRNYFIAWLIISVVFSIGMKTWIPTPH